jgi:DNA repair protein RadC
MNKSFTVQDLPASERPRERLVNLGPEALSVPEILAIILGRGTRGEPVMAVAQKLLSKYGSLEKLAGAPVSDLMKVKGIGEAKATQIKAAFELARRLDNGERTRDRIVIKRPEDILPIVRADLLDKKKEHFFIVLLDTRNQYIGREKVSVGSLDTSIVHPREVFRPAVAASASSVILVHNHPSGNLEPSEEDIKITRRLVEAAEIMGIEVLDHIIISDKKCLSLKARKVL